MRMALAKGTVAGALAVAIVAITGGVVTSDPRSVERADAARSDAARAPARPQQRASYVRPDPRVAGRDKSRAWKDGCQPEPREIRSPRCVYGDPDGRKTVVITGDSHALMYFPALHVLAKERGWRLLAQTKVGCPVNTRLVYNLKLRRGYTECLEWQRDYFWPRMRRERPDLIITSSWARHKTMRMGPYGHVSAARDPQNRRRLIEGYVDALQRLRAASGPGVRFAVMKDTPMSPHDVPNCVARSLHNLPRCAFPITREYERLSFEGRVAAAVPDAAMVNLVPIFCPDGLCHAVINNRILLRDDNHMSATYAQTLWRHFAERLPAVR